MMALPHFLQLCMEYVAGANLNKLLLEADQPFCGDVSVLCNAAPLLFVL